MFRPLRSLSTLTIAAILVSCSYPIPRRLKDNFTFKYTPDKKDLSNLVNINGYFSVNNKNRYSNYLFFDDGVVIIDVVGLRDFKNDREIYQSPDKLPSFFSKLSKDTANTLDMVGAWGTYVITHDTIKAQIIDPAYSWNQLWQGFEYHFKVIDRETIKLVYMKRLHHLSYNDRKRYTQEKIMKTIEDVKPAKFIKCDTIPSSNCWMKKKKWFWANEADYNNYINKIDTETKKH